MKYLFVRLSCKAEKDRWDEFRKQDPNQIILCGDDTIDSNYKLEGDVLYLKCGDNYGSLPEKMIFTYNSLLLIDKFKDVDRFIKVDSDCTITPKFNNTLHITKNALMEHDYCGQMLSYQNNPPDYVGQYHFNRVPKGSYWDNRTYRGDWGKWADGGCSYILSRKSLECVSKTYGFDDIEKVRTDHIYEDLMMSLILRKYNIVPSKVSIGIKNKHYMHIG